MHVTVAGDSVYVNVPLIAIPKKNINNHVAGTYGRIIAENHNVYECYPAPYIAM